MILVIDNYDSFVYNLVHYIEDLGASTEAQDECDSAMIACVIATSLGLCARPWTKRFVSAG